ncbi:CAAX protease self-immunity [Filimonas lacunae]|uniref:CAAX protease self-immunity n=1 Tax=Filimonas lacunae TaxID=477680 RepID=A0A173MI55_9BACT|nr:CPBP family intramembrane glutamic endopeptidase [Filimonas lacunae]BAV07101.1 CAAX amino terminal protease family protein [Filimonas lacunae]SIS94973.1 CAAX protease self-immunity [Filimonas lacunae]
MFKKIPVAALIVFYVIALGIRYLVTKTDLLHTDNFFLQTILRGSGTTIGALIAAAIFGIKIQLTPKGKFPNLLITIILYWVFPIIILLIYPLFTTTMESATGAFALLLYALLEEIGWRGFLRPLLAQAGVSKFANIVIVSILWYFWHLNFGFSTGHLVFFALLLVGSWGIGAVADKTGSFLAVAAFHSLNNIHQAAVPRNVSDTVPLVILFAVWLASVLLFDKFTRREKTQVAATTI